MVNQAPLLEIDHAALLGMRVRVRLLGAKVGNDTDKVNALQAEAVRIMNRLVRIKNALEKRKKTKEDEEDEKAPEAPTAPTIA